MDDRKFVVIDNEGNEKEMYILFTYTDEENTKNYVFYTDPADENHEVFVSAYDEDGTLYAVEDDSEWDMLEDVYESFQSQQHECGCHHDHEGDCCCEHDGDCDCDCDDDHECCCHHDE